MPALTHDQQNLFYIVAIITILTALAGANMLSIFKRNPFGFFATGGAFMLTLGWFLAFNAQYDVAHHFVKFKVIDGIIAMKPGTVLFWGNIPQQIITVIIVIGIAFIPPATVSALVRSKKMDRIAKEHAQWKLERAEMVKIGVLKAEATPLIQKTKQPARIRTKQPVKTSVE